MMLCAQMIVLSGCGVGPHCLFQETERCCSSWFLRRKRKSFWELLGLFYYVLFYCISVFKWFMTTFVLYYEKTPCSFPALALLLSPVPQDGFLLPEVLQWWCSSFDCVQLESYFLVVSRNV